ncbi:MAG: hypothetical protein WD267_08955 [Balneolales bacterium]
MNQNPISLKASLLKIAALVLSILVFTSVVQAQDTDNREVSPGNALLRSFVMPGWGHHYVDRDNWRRGQYHLAADVILIASYLGFRTHSNVLEQNMYTVASAHSGQDITNRDRAYQLAVGNYHSLAEYNDYQQRTRNLDQLYPNTIEYQWEWDSQQKRQDYGDIRSQWNQTNQQLPALLSLMVVNRIISGLSAFSRARNHNTNIPQISFSHNPYLKGAVQANLLVRW